MDAEPRGPWSRDKILETAEALFAASGLSGVGMRKVAEDVGLSKSSLFHHFPTKLSLCVAVLQRGLIELDQRLLATESAATGSGEKLMLWLDEIVDVLAEHPTRVAALLEAGIGSGEFHAVLLPQTLQTLIGVIVYHFASGEFGDDLIGAPVFSAAEIRSRQEHVRDLMKFGLFSDSN